MNEPLVRTRRLGRLTLHALNAGFQWLDGGAMFGVVPRPLWEKRIQPDARHRIPLALRCLLVETPDALVLIDNGVGNKETPKFKEIYGVANESAGGAPSLLDDALAAAGFGRGDIDIMIDTHLHFDHAGGNTFVDEEGEVLLAFPRAQYYVQRGEYEYAHWKNERIAASYLGYNYDPVHAAGKLELVEGDIEVLPGVELLRTPGHTPHHQSVLLRSDGETACYLADLIPMSHHLPLAWIMGYDVEPLVTLESKRALLERARHEDWLLVFEHDPTIAWGKLDPAADRPHLGPTNDAA